MCALCSNKILISRKESQYLPRARTLCNRRDRLRKPQENCGLSAIPSLRRPGETPSRLWTGFAHSAAPHRTGSGATGGAPIGGEAQIPAAPGRSPAATAARPRASTTLLAARARFRPPRWFRLRGPQPRLQAGNSWACHPPTWAITASRFFFFLDSLNI